jgi:hypothetical protein
VYITFKERIIAMVGAKKNSNPSLGVTDEALVSYFHKHLVPFCAIFTKDNKAAVYVATAFVLSAKEEWFLVTAGHVGLDIKEYLQDSEYRLDKILLYDYGGLDAIHYEPIPFELTSDSLLVLGDDTTLDYAVVHIRPHYKRLLAANGIVPLNEEVWLKHPKQPEFFMMLGVPHQMISVEYNNDTNSAISQVNFVTALLNVEHSPRRPVGLAQRSCARWYGYAKLAPPIDDISGMSGAPIFAFQRMSNGELRYWLIGVQSSWNSGNKAIAACPATDLGNYLIEGIKIYEDLYTLIEDVKS